VLTLSSSLLGPTTVALNALCGSVDDFECGNGDCINYSLTCDGMAHCKDKSDEKQSYCGESLCIRACICLRNACLQSEYSESRLELHCQLDLCPTKERKLDVSLISGDSI
jgi:hypothetical protein